MQNNKEIQKNFYNSAFNEEHLWKESNFSESTRYFTNRFLESIIKPNLKEVLEIGCGNGFLTFFLLKKNELSHVTAVDISDKAVKNVEKQFKNEIEKGRLRVICGDLIKFLEDSNESFDIIIGSGIIHHIDKTDWNKFFSSVYKKLKPGGVFACAPEPNSGGIYHIFWHFAKFFYKLFGINYDWEVEKRTLNMKPKKLKIFLKKAGFEKAEILPFQAIPHFHLNFLTYIDKKIIENIKGRFSMYIIVKGIKL